MCLCLRISISSHIFSVFPAVIIAGHKPPLQCSIRSKPYFRFSILFHVGFSTRITKTTHQNITEIQMSPTHASRYLCEYNVGPICRF